MTSGGACCDPKFIDLCWFFFVLVSFSPFPFDFWIPLPHRPFLGDDHRADLAAPFGLDRPGAPADVGGVGKCIAGKSLFGGGLDESRTPLSVSMTGIRTPENHPTVPSLSLSFSRANTHTTTQETWPTEHSAHCSSSTRFAMWNEGRPRGKICRFRGASADLDRKWSLF